MTAWVGGASRSIGDNLEGAAVYGQAFTVTVAGDVGLPAVIASGVAGGGALPDTDQIVVTGRRRRDRDDGRAGALKPRLVAQGVAAVGVVRTEIGPFSLKQITRYNLSWLCRRDIARIK
ncbi:MAG: hypothetical protein QF574_08265 [Arenicellales bacterium]|nr:hypothetical protein [Arenicellales bacterium]